MDAVSLAQDLIRCPSVTPLEGGAMDLLQRLLEEKGFTCHRLLFGDVHNLFATIGKGSPHLCFMGHTDVVPPGDTTAWSVDPFAAEIRDAMLWGRGAADMKGGIACFMAALWAYLEKQPLEGTISLLITGDEEGKAVNGTVKVVEWLHQQGMMPEAFLVGEATNEKAIGDMIKIGRRGSLTGTIMFYGTQGHVAYPHLADNPIERLITTMQKLLAMPLDPGNDRFLPTNLQITSIDVGNTATNIIPGQATAKIAIRFGEAHTGDELIQRIHAILTDYAGHHEVSFHKSGSAFYSDPSSFLCQAMQKAIQTITGLTPTLSTTGGTSDARFVYSYGPVLEFGLCSKTIHKIDECVPLQDMKTLTSVYQEFLSTFFRG